MELADIHEKCGGIFESTLLEEPGSRSLACEIYDTMVQGTENHENCIGENFNQLIQNVLGSWFKGFSPNEHTTNEFYTYTYVLWLYLFVERMEFIIHQVDPDKKFEPISRFYRGLESMNEIRLWANFIKHPKNFLFVHWPQFIFVGERIPFDGDRILINTIFLKDHYSSERQESPKQLDNKDKVIVQFPKLDLLTKGFCEELLSFVRFICDNQIIRDELKKKSNRPVAY